MERLHYSIGGKTFRAILLFTLIISLSAAGFGSYLYIASIRREYRSRTWQMSRTGAYILDTEKTLFIIKSEFSFSRMHVYIHHICWKLNEKRCIREFMLHNMCFISLFNGSIHNSTLNISLIYKIILKASISL